MASGNSEISENVENLTEKNTEFIIEDIDINIAPALRKFTAQTSILAIDYITVHVNTSDLSNEFVSSRLSCIPFTSSEVLNILELPRKCTCGHHCSKCSVKITLDVKWTSFENRHVTTANLVSGDPRVLPATASSTNKAGDGDDAGESLILVLREGQELKLTAYARKILNPTAADTDPDNVPKHTYEEVGEPPNGKHSEVNIEDGEASADCAVTPPMFHLDGAFPGALLSENIVLEALDYLKTEISNLQRRLTEEGEALAGTVTPEQSHFDVESTGALLPQNTVAEAVAELKAKLSNLKMRLSMGDDGDMQNN